jgi:hypothetical protein
METNVQEIKLGRITIDCVTFLKYLEVISDKTRAIRIEKNNPVIINNTFKYTVFQVTVSQSLEVKKYSKFLSPTNLLLKIPFTELKS